MDVRRVSAEEYAADAQAVDHAAVDAEPAAPAHVMKTGGDVRALIIDLLYLLERRGRIFAWLAQRIAGNDLEENVAPHVGGGRCNFPRLGFGDDPKAKYDGTYC